MATQCETTLTVLCNPCNYENKNVTAEGFCHECEEYLCSTCLRYHSRLAGTKTHNVIHGEEMTKNAKQTLRVPEFCPIHDKQSFEFFCQTHGELVCSVCRKQVHIECKDVEKVSDFVNKTDIDGKLETIMQELDKLQMEVKETLHELKVSFKAIELNHSEARAHLLQARENKNAYLDQLQRTISDEIDGLRKKDLEVLQNLKESCKTVDNEIDNTKKTFDLMQSQNDKLGLFAAVESLKSRIVFNRKNLTQIRCDNSVKRYKFTPENEFRVNQSSCGRIDFESGVVKTVKLIKSLNVRQETEEQCYITGIEIIDNNKLVVADYAQKSLKLVDVTVNRVLSSVQFKTNPWSVSFLGNSSTILGVTFPEDQTIVSVDVSQSDLSVLEDQQIKVEGKCYGICAYDGNILVSFCDPARVEIIDKKGTSLKVFDAPVKNPKYLAVDQCRGIVFLSDQDNGTTIKTVRLKGTEPVILDMPLEKYGPVTTDRTGVLYYSCYTQTRRDLYRRAASQYSQYSIYVYRYSEDKHRSTQLLLENIEATSTAYCDFTNRLFISTKGKGVQVYYAV